MEEIRDFHHYKNIPNKDVISRLELEVASSLVNNDLGDEARESSAIFELKHSSNVTQFARLLADRYSIPSDVAAAGALLHDIYVIVSGRYKDHARLGVPIADGMLLDVGIKGEAFRSDVAKIVGNHSDKHLYSADHLCEFGKDIDVLDCFLYPRAIEFYLLNKPTENVFHYLNRAKKIWRGLQLSVPRSFATLDGMEKDWVAFDKVENSFARSLLIEAQACTNVSLFIFHPVDGSRVEVGSPKVSLHLSRQVFDAAQRNRTDNAKRPNELVSKLFEGSSLILWPFIGAYEILSDEAKALQRISEISRLGGEHA